MFIPTHAAAGLSPRPFPPATMSLPPGRVGGFTLIEMAIVVAIFGLMAGGGLLGVSAWMEKEAIKTTSDRLDRIERALTLYAIQTGCLPCPYNPSVAAPGTALGTCGSSTTGMDVGLVPYRELGLTRVDVLDGWNRYIDYTSYSAFSDGGTCTSKLFYSSGAIAGLSSYTTSPQDGAPASGDTQLNGLIRVMDNSETAAGDNATPATNTATAMSVRGVYALVSHGRNGFGAYTTYKTSNSRAAMPATSSSQSSAGEVENADDDAAFASEAMTGTTGSADTGTFDDIVRSRTAAQIIQDAQ